MYQFSYGYVKKKYQDHAYLLFTGTDSLCYLIPTKYIFVDMTEDENVFDFFYYSQNHPLFSTTNEKMTGKFKDELNGELALEFVASRPKCIL